eukprot:EC786669.1.p2 GENE.EC786669.1~~EC786669.1.p2  ORF type:complete len:113 (-),score=6.64 EC786669.1:38-376(-)
MQGSPNCTLPSCNTAFEGFYLTLTAIRFSEARFANYQLVVFDLTRPLSFEKVLEWKREIDEKVRTDHVPGRPPIPDPCVLVGNKSDLDLVMDRNVQRRSGPGRRRPPGRILW